MNVPAGIFTIIMGTSPGSINVISFAKLLSGRNMRDALSSNADKVFVYFICTFLFLEIVNCLLLEHTHRFSIAEIRKSAVRQKFC